MNKILVTAFCVVLSIITSACSAYREPPKVLERKSGKISALIERCIAAEKRPFFRNLTLNSIGGAGRKAFIGFSADGEKVVILSTFDGNFVSVWSQHPLSVDQIALINNCS